MREAFINHRFSPASLESVEIINGILDEYQRQGFRLSLRQLYYQLVARDFIENSQRSYKNIGSLVSTARQAGLIDWGMIEDRNRETVIPAHWNNPGEIVEAAANQFRIDKWRDQPNHVEVMVEKDALSGVLEPVCSQLDIGITANKGYSSSSMMYEIGKRIEKHYDDGKSIHILYLGDHDPSGIDMTRDIEERLILYSNNINISMNRLALNMDQINKWNPPENPAKENDSRYRAYRDEFGDSSWELDAVEPRQLADLVRNSVVDLLDPELWEAAKKRESDLRDELLEFVDNYSNREE